MSVHPNVWEIGSALTPAIIIFQQAGLQLSASSLTTAAELLHYEASTALSVNPGEVGSPAHITAPNSVETQTKIDQLSLVVDILEDWAEQLEQIQLHKSSMAFANVGQMVSLEAAALREDRSGVLGALLH